MQHPEFIIVHSPEGYQVAKLTFKLEDGTAVYAISNNGESYSEKTNLLEARKAIRDLKEGK